MNKDFERCCSFLADIYMNGRNVLGVDWDNESTDETVALLTRTN